MRAYVLVSAAFFGMLMALQLVRFLYGWPVTVAGLSVPVWVSGVGAIVAGALAAWGLRAALLSAPEAWEAS